MTYARRMRALLLGLFLIGCTRTIDADKAKKIITDGLADHHMALKSISCPADVKIVKGATFVCTGVTADDQPMTFDMTQQDDEGLVKWELRGKTVNTDDIKTDVVKRLGDQATVTCPHKITIAQANEPFICDVSRGSETKHLQVTTDAAGTVSYKLDP
jgi:hypothetical protein